MPTDVKKTPSQKRPRLVSIMGWFLFLQSFVLSGFSIYHFIILQFGPAMLNRWWLGNAYEGNRLLNLSYLLADLISQAVELRALAVFIESIALLLFAFFALIASIGFFTQRKWAWLLAMLVQAATLSLSVILYFIKQPAHTYLLMAYCSFMVFYLQYADIYKSFQKTALFLDELDA